MTARTTDPTLLTESEAEALLDLLMYNAQTDTENSQLYFTIANKVDEMIIAYGYADESEAEAEAEAEPETD